MVLWLWCCSLETYAEVFKNEVLQYLPQTLKWFIKHMNTLRVLMCTHVYTHTERETESRCSKMSIHCIIAAFLWV